MRAVDANGEAMVCVRGMREPHSNSGCTTLECRVREALRADDRPSAEGDTIDVDAAAALEVLCKVSAELLAHYPVTKVSAFFVDLVAWRERWKKDAIVMAQQEPQGRA
jgi:hypothetical protein